MFHAFDSLISLIENFFSEEFWARIYRIVIGSILIIIALLSSLRSPVMWRQ